MITTFLRKSTFINYSFVALLLIFFFTYFNSTTISTQYYFAPIAQNVLTIILLLISLFIVNFIVKKNGLTKDSSYTILIFVLLMLLFPSSLSNLKLITANFFILLALRRLVSIKNLKAPKQKIFDASLFIFVASVFHFWSILFLFLCYFTIILHVSRDFRNWIIPIIAFVVSVVMFVFISLIFDNSWIDYIVYQTQMNFQWDYFVNNYKKLALTIFALISVYFVSSMIFTLGNKPLVLQASYKKMIVSFFIGVIVFLFSPDKSNAILLFSFFPLSVLITNNIEYSKNKTYQEIVLFSIVVITILAYLFQL